MANIHNSLRSMTELELLARGDTAVHRLPALTKIVAVFVFIVLTLSFSPQDLSAMTIFIFFPMIAAALADIPPREIVKRVLIALPFPFFAGLSNLLLNRDIVAVILGVEISGGFISLISIMLKTCLCVAAVLILAASTPFMELTEELARLKIPPSLLLVFTMIYRYIAILAGEAAGMYSAYMLRSPGAKGIRLGHMGTFLGQLLLRSFGRAERVYLAMKLRGYNRTIPPPARRSVKPVDAALIMVICAIMFIFRFINVPLLIGGLLV